MSNSKIGFHRLFKAESPRVEDAEKGAWATKIEAMTDAEFFSTPAHVVAPDRPLLQKPAPEYVSSREMLNMFWHRSPWAPVDDIFDLGLEYALTHDLEMLEFQEWILAVLALRFLPANVQADDGAFCDARIDRMAYSSLAVALLRNLPVPCHVRKASGEHLFPHNAPMVPANGALWFRRGDVEALPCDKDAVAQAFMELADAEANSAANAETAGAINGEYSALAGVMAADAPGLGVPAVSTDTPTTALKGTTTSESEAEHRDHALQAAGKMPEPMPMKRARRKSKQRDLEPFIRKVFAARVAAKSGQYVNLTEMRKAVGDTLPNDLFEVDNRTIDRAAILDEGWKVVCPPTVRKHNRHSKLS